MSSSALAAATDQQREEALFLPEHEAFTFDFGGEAVAAADNEEEEQVQQQHGVSESGDRLGKGEEDNVSIKKKGTTQSFAAPLSGEEVQRLAEEALQKGLHSFCHITAAAAGSASSNHNGKQRGKEKKTATVVLSLEEAVHAFQRGIRGYEEGLYRTQKQHRAAAAQKSSSAKVKVAGTKG